MHRQDQIAEARKLLDHLDRLPPLISDTLQVGHDILERQFVAFPEAQGELAIEIRGLDLQKRRGHRQNRNGNALGSQAPKSDRPLFQDLSVRRQAGERRHVQRRQKLRARRSAAGFKQIEK